MSAKGYLLKEAGLLPMSLGAALLGTGGGGNPYTGMLRARADPEERDLSRAAARRTARRGLGR